MEKIKQFLIGDQGKDFFIVLIIIIVGLGSFGLGRLSKTTNKGSGITIEYTDIPSNAPSNAITAVNEAQNTKIGQNMLNPEKAQKGAFFASNRGSKYYSIGCSGGKTLKEENKIYFDTEAEAKKAGYEISSTCKQAD